MPELAYNYYSVIANSKQLNEQEVRNKMAMNPISLSGRLSIIKGTFFFPSLFEGAFILLLHGNSS